MHGRGVAEGQIGAPDGAGKEQVARQAESVSDKRHVPRCMAREVSDIEAVLPELHHVTFSQRVINRRGTLDDNAPARGAAGGVGVQDGVGRMEPNRYGLDRDDASDAAYMIEVGMGEPDRVKRTAGGGNRGEQGWRLIAGIDEHGFPAVGISEQPAVLLERANGELLQPEGGHGAVASGVSGTGASAVSRTGDSPMPWCASHRSASKAAIQPVPADVIACR